jgi:hypothetical protein
MKNVPKIDNNFIVIAVLLFIVIWIVMNKKKSYKKRPSGRRVGPFNDLKRFFGSIKR